MKPTLFIGGVADGDWIEVSPPLPVWKIPIAQKKSVKATDIAPAAFRLKVEEYQRVEIGTAGVVYVSTCLRADISSVIGMLINGYERGKSRAVAVVAGTMPPMPIIKRDHNKKESEK